MDGPGPKYEVIRYHPGLLAGVLEFVRPYWGSDDALNQAYLSWKYEANPYVALPHLYLVSYQGKLVGIRGFMASAWEAEGLDRSKVLFCAGDLAVDPAHRGKGLVPAMLESFRADQSSAPPQVLSLSANAAARISMLRAGWRYVAPLLRFWRPGRGRLKSLLQRLDWRKSAEALPPDISISDSPEVDAMVDLVDRIGHDGRIRMVRDRAYMKWRFLNPRLHYGFCYLRSNRVRAYLVFRTRPNRPDGVKILDWEGETAEERRKLLLATLRIMDGPVEMHRSALEATDRSALADAGFVERAPDSRSNRHAALFVISGRPDGSPGAWKLGRRNLLDIDEWDYRGLYADGG